MRSFSLQTISSLDRQYGRAQTSADYVSPFEHLSRGDIDRGSEAFRRDKEQHLRRHPDLESSLNRWGYVHLRSDSVNTALGIFRLNVDLFPESANVYDSYGEALMLSGQIDLAIQNCRKSFELNSQNQNAASVLKGLGDQ